MGSIWERRSQVYWLPLYRRDNARVGRSPSERHDAESCCKSDLSSFYAQRQVPSVWYRLMRFAEEFSTSPELHQEKAHHPFQY